MCIINIRMCTYICTHTILFKQNKHKTGVKNVETNNWNKHIHQKCISSTLQCSYWLLKTGFRSISTLLLKCFLHWICAFMYVIFYMLLQNMQLTSSIYLFAQKFCHHKKKNDISNSKTENKNNYIKILECYSTKAAGVDP